MSCLIHIPVRSFEQARRTFAQVQECLTDLDTAVTALGGGGVAAGGVGYILATASGGSFGALSPGTDGDAIIADSAQTRGLKWGIYGEIVLDIQSHTSAQSV